MTDLSALKAQETRDTLTNRDDPFLPSAPIEPSRLRSLFGTP